MIFFVQMDQTKFHSSTQNPKELIGQCVEITNNLYPGQFIIEDISPYGHVYITNKHRSVWIRPEYNTEWKKCKGAWSHVKDRELIGKCVTRTKPFKGIDDSYTNSAIFVGDIKNGMIISGDSKHRFNFKWNDENWVIAPSSMPCYGKPITVPPKYYGYLNSYQD